MPVRLQHDQRMVVEHLQHEGQALHAAGTRLVEWPVRYLTFRQIHVPFVEDRPCATLSLVGLVKRANEMGGFQMRITMTCAALALALGSGPAFAQSGEITIWSWNIAA